MFAHCQSKLISCLTTSTPHARRLGRLCPPQATLVSPSRCKSSRFCVCVFTWESVCASAPHVDRGSDDAHHNSACVRVQVLLICYSIISPQSLENVRSKWYATLSPNRAQNPCVCDEPNTPPPNTMQGPRNSTSLSACAFRVRVTCARMSVLSTSSRRWVPNLCRANRQSLALAITLCPHANLNCNAACTCYPRIHRNSELGDDPELLTLLVQATAMASEVGAAAQMECSARDLVKRQLLQKR